MIGWVEFCGKVAIERMVPRPGVAVISISGPESDPKVADPARLKPGWDHVLRLQFHDIVEPAEGYVHFTVYHARQIIAFLDQVQDKIEGVIVQCIAGASRSAAVARFVAERYKISLHQPTPLANTHVYNTLKGVAQ